MTAKKPITSKLGESGESSKLKPVTILRNKFLELRCLHDSSFEIGLRNHHVCTWSLPRFPKPIPFFFTLSLLKQLSREAGTLTAVTGRTFHEVSRYPRHVRRHRKMARKV